MHDQVQLLAQLDVAYLFFLEIQRSFFPAGVVVSIAERLFFVCLWLGKATLFRIRS